MIIGKYNKSVILTYLGASFAVTGIFFAADKDEHWKAMICLVVAGVADMFDGMVARKCKRTEEDKYFGIQIDSLADMVGFVILPVMILIGLGLTRWYHILISICYVLAAIIRLGFFNLNANAEAPVKYYRGVPVTSSAIVMPAAYLISYLFEFEKRGITLIFPLSIAALAILFISDIPIKKPKKMAFFVFAILAIVWVVIIIHFGVLRK